jgi:hypothetical protein
VNVCDSPVNPVDVSLVHVGLVPEYQTYVYGDVPVVGALIVRVVGCPLFITELLVVGADDATSAGFTVTCVVSV